MPVLDTITACATGSGRAGRALIRVSGSMVGEIERRLLTRSSLSARSAWADRFRLTDRLSLPLLVLRGRAPRTYTGEDTLELLLPGNPHLVHRVLQRLTAVASVRPAEPGEFTARAYLAGKLTLDQAEAVAATVAASTDDALSAAHLLLNGETGAVYRRWAEEAATLLALVEAGIDFTDQDDVVAITTADLRARTAALLAAIDSALGARAGGAVRTGLPVAVLVGPPNAGKSTLFNSLLGRSRALVSPVAGTTRDVLREPLLLHPPQNEALAIELVDLAGFHDGLAAADSTDALAQSAARTAVETADLLVLCSPTGAWPNAAALNPRAAAVHVHTKADRSVPLPGALNVCALTGHGLPALVAAMHEAIWTRTVAPADTGLLPRHALALRTAAEHLRDALHASDAARELTASHLRAALDAIGRLTGQLTPDEIIGRIFATFCIGK